MEKTTINTLTEEQSERAYSWYLIHRDHVDLICKENESRFPPSLFEDKQDPRLWKPGHWNWFLSTY